MKYFTQEALTNALGEDFQMDNIQQYLRTCESPQIASFLEYISSPNAGLFMEWTEQSPSLMAVINNGQDEPFYDASNITKHSLFPYFQRFVSPFLSPRLIEIAKDNPQSISLQHIVLLEQESRSLVERIIHNKVCEELKKLRSDSITKKQWERSVVDLVGQKTHSIYLFFSTTSYSYVIAYIEACLLLIQRRQCEPKVGAWILTQLMELNLTSDHQKQLATRLQTIRSASIYQHNSNKQHLFLRVVGLCLIVVAVAFFVYITKNS